MKLFAAAVMVFTRRTSRQREVGVLASTLSICTFTAHTGDCVGEQSLQSAVFPNL
jgi:hypothetical protein